MLRNYLCCCALLLAPALAGANDAADEDAEKRNLGMSILGNQEAPTSLVIVPWKSSELGNRPDLARLLDDATRPVDKEVFMRELEYYRIRAE
jgi:hypothetical protein